MTRARTAYDDVVVAAPVTVPYVRYSIRGAQFLRLVLDLQKRLEAMPPFDTSAIAEGRRLRARPLTTPGGDQPASAAHPTEPISAERSRL